MYCTQQASSYGSSMDLIPIAEEIIFKCSHGQSAWREQRTQYLHLPIKSIFVSRVNNLCYSPSWKTRQGRYLSSCRACIGKQHPTERNLNNKLQIIRISRQVGGKKRVNKTPSAWFFLLYFCFLFQGDVFNWKILHISYAPTPNVCLSALQVWPQKVGEQDGKGFAGFLSSSSIPSPASSNHSQCKRKC